MNMHITASIAQTETLARDSKGRFAKSETKLLLDRLAAFDATRSPAERDYINTAGEIESAIYLWGLLMPRMVDLLGDDPTPQDQFLAGHPDQCRVMLKSDADILMRGLLNMNAHLRAVAEYRDLPFDA